MTRPQRITTVPSPLVQGADGEVCYEFGEGITEPVTLRTKWSPCGSEQEHQVTPEHPCAAVGIPKGTHGLHVSDLSGQSLDFGAIVKLF